MTMLRGFKISGHVVIKASAWSMTLVIAVLGAQLAVGRRACVYCSGGASRDGTVNHSHNITRQHGDGEQDELAMMLCTVACLFLLQATHRYRQK